MDVRQFDVNSNIIRIALKNSSTGAPLTILDHTSTGLIISTILDNEATATAYTVAGSTIETITTIGTFAAPTATKCRFKAVDATNHPGLYEIQIADARFSVASSKVMTISVSGYATLLATDYQIMLVGYDPFSALATPTNITAGTITTATNVTTVNGLAANVITATSINADAITAAKVAADVTTEITAGLATSANQTTINNNILALNNLSAAQVNAEVLDVLNVDTFAQPGQGTPAATTSIRLMLAYLYKAWRNKTTQTSTVYSLFNDDAATVDHKATVSDDATTFTKGEVATGP